MRYATLLAAVAALALVASSARAGACPEERLVQNWYARYLHREADRCGLENAVRQLRCGVAPEQIEASILASEEFYHRHGCTPEGFVAALYEDVLGRQPCHREVELWLRRLGACGCRAQLAKEFLCAARRELAGAAAPVVYVPERYPVGWSGRITVRPVPMVEPPAPGGSLRIRARP
jgi:hypothetical protein